MSCLCERSQEESLKMTLPNAMRRRDGQPAAQAWRNSRGEPTHDEFLDPASTAIRNRLENGQALFRGHAAEVFQHARDGPEVDPGRAGDFGLADAAGSHNHGRGALIDSDVFVVCKCLHGPHTNPNGLVCQGKSSSDWTSDA